MKILALDTSTAVGSVAVLENTQLLAEHTLRAPMQLLGWLCPAIQEILDETRIPLAEIDAVAVGVGPGSFTGVRLELATARTLAQVRKIPLYGISSLDALAFQALPHTGMILACMDAKRSELFAGIFQASGTSLTRIGPYLACKKETLLEKVQHYQEPWVLAGEDNPYESYFKTRLPHCKISEKNNGFIRASSIGLLAYDRQSQLSGNPHGVEPIYIRASNAELDRLPPKETIQKS